jgi:hypothetical protein
MTKCSDPSAARRSGDISRRALLGCTAGLAATVLSGTRGSRAQQKMSKQAAQYQDSPRGDEKCADCRFFVEGGSCQVVEGEISPDGWCTLFQPEG